MLLLSSTTNIRDLIIGLYNHNDRLVLGGRWCVYLMYVIQINHKIQ